MHRLIGKPQDLRRVIYKKYITELSVSISIRSLDMEQDWEMLVNWMNQGYAKAFWLLNAKPEALKTTYEKVLQDAARHAFIICADDEPIALIDLYLISADELADHIEHNDTDAGMHILMGPPREMQKGFSFYAIKCLQEYFFSFSDNERLFAEPDQGNYHANRLAINTGFQLVKTVQLSYKTANLYLITRK